MTGTERASTNPFLEAFFAGILEDAHHFEAAPNAVVTRSGGTSYRTRLRAHPGISKGRQVLERVIRKGGFARRRYDPLVAAQQLMRVVHLSDGLNHTFSLLSDDDSRQNLLDVLKLRVLGPRHARLPVSSADYRAKQTYADREFLLEAATFEVSDPYFSPISLYRVPVRGRPVTLHCHSVDLVSVFLLDQYSYSRPGYSVHVEPGDTVIDIGACWGDTALYFSELTGGSGRVISFEFDPDNLKILHENLPLNPELAPRIEMNEMALWDTSGEPLTFAQAGRMTTVATEHTTAPSLVVPTVTLDDFVEARGIRSVDFIKADVEGVEMRVLKGAERTLRRFAPKIAISAYHHDDDLVRLPQFLDDLDLGYRFYLKSCAPVEEETVLFATARR